MTDLAHDWRDPPQQLCLTGGQVHLWCTQLEVSASQIEELLKLLSADELRRARRYKFDHHRRRFIVCRGRQRLILSRYLAVPPDEICFEYESFGKPALATADHERRIQFNVSNSHEMAMYAVACDRALGVDIEYIRPLPDLDGLSQRYFAAAERQALEALAGEQRLLGFFACWTRKEAVIKALGTGLSTPLDGFAVSLAPDDPAKLLSFPECSATDSHWWMHGMKPARGYVAALASPGDPLQVEQWKWTDS